MLNTGSLTIQRQMANSWFLHCSHISKRAWFLQIIIQQIPRQGDGAQPRRVTLSVHSEADGILHSFHLQFNIAHMQMTVLYCVHSAIRSFFKGAMNNGSM